MTRNGGVDADTDRLMALVHEEVARLRASRVTRGEQRIAGAAQSAPSTDGDVRPRLMRWGGNEATLEQRDAYRVPDFLAFHDEDFVRNAYRAILRRAPDPQGFADYLGALRSGRLAKVEVLGRLRYSREGRSHGVPVRGLAFAFGLRMLRRVPVLGRLAGIAQYVVRLPDLARNHERLEAAYFHREHELARHLDAAQTQLEDVLAQHAAALVDLASSSNARQQQILAVHQEMRGLLDQAIERHVQDRAELEAAMADITAKQGSVEQATQQVRARIDAMADELQNVRTLATEVERRARAGLERERELMDLLQRTPDLATQPAAGVSAELDHVLDPLYVSFEDRFRGTRADIKTRLAVYVPLVVDAHAGTPTAPLLDIGCGRGEWLELLRDHGMVARGVDLNRVMLAECRERHMKVAEADGIAYLQSLADASLGAITAIHVIEHLPFVNLVRLFDEARRVLRPGGILIFETPNPENLIVGACNFYLDPTHERPLPPETTRFVAEARGFERIEVMRLHPFPAGATVPHDDDPLGERINALLYGPQDYALVARKPM